MSERELKQLASMRFDNRRTISLLESLKPIRPDDIVERDKQLHTANKLKDLLVRVEGALFGDKP